MKEQEKQRVVVWEGRDEHRVCGRAALGDVTGEVRLTRSKTFSFLTIPFNLNSMACRSIMGHGKAATVCKMDRSNSSLFRKAGELELKMKPAGIQLKL